MNTPFRINSNAVSNRLRSLSKSVVLLTLSFILTGQFDVVAQTRVTNINPGPGSSTPQYMTLFQGELYFSADDGTNGAELWSFNGTTSTLKADIRSGALGSNPAFLKVYNNKLYFQADDGTFGTELFVYDGISATRVSDINAGTGNSNPQSLYVYGSKLYFNATTPATGAELWSYDGVSVSLAADIITGATGSAPSNFCTYGSDLFFSASAATNGVELWRYNGVTASQVSDINPGSNSSSPQYLTVYNGNLFFSADNGTVGNELFKYNGASVSLLTDVIPGSASGNPINLILSGGFLYFRADDGINGQEIWASNGNFSSMLSDVNNGSGGSAVSSPAMVTYNGGLYFAANVPSLGTEIWSWVQPNVSPIGDIIAGPGSANPSELTIYRNRLYVRADEGVNGAELWEFNLPTPNYSFRTASSGNWNDLSTWEMFDGTYWVPSDSIPNGLNGGTITVRSGHFVSNNSQNINADQLVIENGGSIFISEGTLHILDGAGTDFTCDGALNINTGSIVNDGIAEFTGISTFNWGGMTHISGTGTINVQSGCTFSISNNNDHGLEGGLVLNNYSECDFSSMGMFTLTDGSVFNNYGIFYITNNGDFNSTPTNGTFNNMAGGQLYKSGTDLSSFASGCTYNNYGSLFVDQGTLSIDGSSGAFTGFIQTEAGAELAGNELIYTGDTIQNNGLISIVALSLEGTNLQYILGNGQFSDLRFNNASGFSIEGDQTVNANLFFDLGLVHTGTNSLRIGETCAVSGASDLCYVVGNMQRFLDGSVTLTYDIGDPDAIHRLL
ncbi:MAG: hypothetical protein IPP38_17830 [Bacteroidetes bacterium]|nr:hypothetical protein [Bacteroidota bacterium]